LAHPGFEMYVDGWFDEHDGLCEAIERGIVVAGGSYYTDESEIDAWYALSKGYKISEIEINPFSFKMSESKTSLDQVSHAPLNMAESAKAGLMNSFGQLWSLKKANGQVDDDLTDLLHLRLHLLNMLSGKGEMVNPMVAREQLSIDEDGKHVIRVTDEISYIYEDNCLIIDDNGEVMVEDIELETTYLDTKNLFSDNQIIMLIASLVYYNLDPE
jgi:hypothetical protein